LIGRRPADEAANPDDPRCRTVGVLSLALQCLYAGFDAEEEVALCRFCFEGR